LSAILLDSSDGTVRDLDRGTITARPRYFVSTNVEANALSDPGLPSLLPGSPHPQYPNLLLRTVAFTPSGGSGFVDLSYSSASGSTSNPQTPTPPDEIDGRRWRWSFRIGTTTIPRQQFVKKTKPNTTGGEDTFRVWEFAQQNQLVVERVYIHRILDLNIEIQNVAQFDVVAFQRNKIHTINGVRYRYLGMENSNTGGTVYSVSHTWEQDIGIRLPASTLNVGSLDSYYQIPVEVLGAQPDPYAPAADGTLLYLFPYHHLDVAYSDDPLTTPHTVHAVATYGDDPDGWRSLPGSEAILR